MSEIKSEAEKQWLRLYGLPINPYLQEAVRATRDTLGIKPDLDWRKFEVPAFESLHDEIAYREDMTTDPDLFETMLDQLMRTFKLPERIRGFIGMYVWTDDTWWLEWGSLLGRGIEVKVRETTAAELEITFSGITPEHSKNDIEKLAKIMQKEREHLLSNEGEQIQNRPMRRLPEHFQWYQQWLLQGRRGYSKIMDEWNVRHEEYPIYNPSTISKAVKRIDECLKT